MTNRIDGARILVTRPRLQAVALCHLIEQHGGEPLRFPTLAIEAIEPSPAAIDMALASDWMIFTSTNAVDFALQAFDGKMTGRKMPAVAAVGGSTADALRRAGWVVDCVPARDFSSEGLLAEIGLQAVDGQSCIIVRGQGGREKIAETLRARGANVGYLEVYRRYRPDSDNRCLVDSLTRRVLAVATVTSEEALSNLLAMLDEDSVALLRKVPLVVVSERIRQAADALGFETIAVSRRPTDMAILETLTMLLSGENSGRSN